MRLHCESHLAHVDDVKGAVLKVCPSLDVVNQEFDVVWLDRVPVPTVHFGLFQIRQAGTEFKG
jgi:hypothetical protein